MALLMSSLLSVCMYLLYAPFASFKKRSAISSPSMPVPAANASISILVATGLTFVGCQLSVFFSFFFLILLN
ncbi:hypothetical protein DER46DRAFT_609059, partial [Fusarium sp. MPI-SDFR-AT-0072]